MRKIADRAPGAVLCVLILSLLSLLILALFSTPGRLVAQQCPQGYTLSGGACVLPSTSGGAAVGYCNVGNITGSNPTPSGQSATFDAGHCGSTAGTYTYFDATLSGNVTSSSITGLTAGQHYTFRLIQNGSSAFTFTPPAAWTNPPSVSTVLGAYVIFSGVWNGSALISLPATSSQGFGQGATMIAPTACPAAPNAFFSWFDPTNLRLETEDATNCGTVNTPGTTKGMGFLPATVRLTGLNTGNASTVTFATQPAGSEGYWHVSLTIEVTTNGTAGTLTPKVTCTGSSTTALNGFSGAAVTISSNSQWSSASGDCPAISGSNIQYQVQAGGLTAGPLQYSLSAVAQRLL